MSRVSRFSPQMEARMRSGAISDENDLANQQAVESSHQAGAPGSPINPAMVGLLNFNTDQNSLGENIGTMQRAHEADFASGAAGNPMTVLARPEDTLLTQKLAEQGTRPRFNSFDYSATPHGVAGADANWWNTPMTSGIGQQTPGFNKFQQQKALQGLYGSTSF